MVNLVSNARVFLAFKFHTERNHKSGNGNDQCDKDNKRNRADLGPAFPLLLP